MTIRPVICAFACGRDQPLVEPFLRHVARAYPGAPVVLASDTADPVAPPPGVRTVPSTWSSAGAPGAVPESLLLAMLAAGQDATHVIKTDLDTAHICARWLDPLATGSAAVGFINPKFPVAWQGPAYALNRSLVFRIAAACKAVVSYCHEEDVAMSLLARREMPNAIWLHPHAPRRGGPFSHWNPAGCGDPAVYAQKFSVVHCGSIPRHDIPALMESLHAAADSPAPLVSHL